ncbi:MAG: hypothetical protein QM765_10585 [Myxococcales bacterium]
MRGTLERAGHLLAGTAFSGLFLLCALVAVVVLRDLGPLAGTSQLTQLEFAVAFALFLLLGVSAIVLQTPERRPFLAWFCVGGLVGLAVAAAPMILQRL